MIIYIFFTIISERSNDDSLLWYQEALVMGKTYLENCIFYSPFMEDLLKTHYYGISDTVQHFYLRCQIFTVH